MSDTTFRCALQNSITVMDIIGFQKMFARILAGTETVIEYTPIEKVSKDSKVFGTLNDPITRSLYSLFVRVGHYIEDYSASNSSVSHGVSNKQLIADILRHKRNLNIVAQFRDAVRIIIWVRISSEIPDTLNVGAKRDLEIAEGWQIADCEISEDEKSDDRNKVSIITVAIPRMRNMAAGKN